VDTFSSRSLVRSRFIGLSSICTSIKLVRTRSRTESVIWRFRRSCVSALSLRSVVVGGLLESACLRRVVVIVVITVHSSSPLFSRWSLFGSLIEARNLRCCSCLLAHNIVLIPTGGIYIVWQTFLFVHDILKCFFHSMSRFLVYAF
jgi:hypothetical protein